MVRSQYQREKGGVSHICISYTKIIPLSSRDSPVSMFQRLRDNCREPQGRQTCAALPVLHPLLPPLALCSCVPLSEGAQVGKVIAALWLAAGLMLPEGSPSNHFFSLGAGVIDRGPCLNIMEN